MANGRNNPNNPAVAKAAPADDQPWNRSTMEIEPLPSPEADPQITSKGRYNDRIKISPMNEQGAATKRAVKGWPEGLKKA